MLDLIQFVLELFTSPVKVIGSIAILGLIIVGLRWNANRSKSNVRLDASPEVILRHCLKFVDEDLEQNRLAIISPKQIKSIRNEFQRLLIAWLALIVFSGFLFVTLFWEDMSGWGLGFLIGLVFLIIIGIAVFQLWGYIQDLRTKRAVSLLTPLMFEEHEGEHMGFRFQTHQYKIIAHDPRLSAPLTFPIGFMSEDVWHQLQKLRHQTAILYIAPNTSKLLSFELVAIESGISQKDVS